MSDLGRRDLLAALVGSSSIAYASHNPPSAATTVRSSGLHGPSFTIDSNGSKVVSAGQGANRTLQNAYTTDLASTPFAYGAVGDDVADDRLAIQAAISTQGITGGVVQIPKATLRTSASSGTCLTVEAPVSIQGLGASVSQINPAAAAADDNTLKIAPNLYAAHDNLYYRDFALMNPRNGQRIGKAGIFIDTRIAGQQLGGLRFEGVIVGQGAGPGLLHVNKSAGPNINGGWFCGGAYRCQFKGGVKLVNSGDSLSFQGNRLSGNGIGYEIALVAGASCFTSMGDNITTTRGAIMVHSGSRMLFANANIEHYARGIATDEDGHRPVVSFLGDAGVGTANKLIGGLISAFGASDANVLVKIKNQRGFLIDGVTLALGIGGVAAIYIDATSSDTIIGQLIGQDIDRNGKAEIVIVDNGVGTIGLIKTAALAAGWELVGRDEEPLQFRKDREGGVQLWGSIRGGAIADGTVITSLPPGFRPAKVVRAAILALEKGRGILSNAHLSIGPDGAVWLTHAGAGVDELRINLIFVAANSGWATTLE